MSKLPARSDKSYLLYFRKKNYSFLEYIISITYFLIYSNIIFTIYFVPSDHVCQVFALFKISLIFARFMKEILAGIGFLCIMFASSCYINIATRYDMTLER